jgi:RNA polymerase sigma-70 factor (ECF subfamily)
MQLAVIECGIRSRRGAEMISDKKFNAIFDEYHPRILRYLSRIVGPVDAEDLSQEVFDKISKGLSRFQGRSSLSTWIYRIATNTAIDRSRSAAYKYAGNQDVFEDETTHDSSGPTPAKTAPFTDQLVIRKEMSDCVNEFIDNLPPDYRTVIVLSELEGFANKEIAEILGISLDNVKIRLHRARTRLRKALQEGCDFYYTDGNTLACDRKQVRILPKPPE